MVRQLLSDAARRAGAVARQVGQETLKVPQEIGQEAARSVGLAPRQTRSEPEEVKEQYGGGDQKVTQDKSAVDQQMVAARAKLRNFAQKRGEEWKREELQGQQQGRQRVQQIVQAQLGQTPEGKPIKEAQKEEAEKKGGLISDLKSIFGGKKRPKRGSLFVPQKARKDAGGEFGKSQQ